MATLARYQGTAQDDAGNILPSPSVTVVREIDSITVQLYSDRAGTVTIGNPFTGATDGTFGFHVAGGAYRIIVTQGATTRTLRYVAIGTAAEQDASAIVPAREKLTANRIYYVRNDGADTNTGLTDSATAPGGAFKTLQKAVDVVWDDIDIAGFDVTIKVSGPSATFAGISKLYPAIGGEPLIDGNTTTPSTYIIQGTSADALDFRRGALVSIQGFKVQTVTSGRGLHSSGTAQVNIPGNMEWGACVSGQICATHGGKIGMSANYAVSGGGLYHMNCDYGGHISHSSATVTLSNTPAFGDAFIVAWSNGAIQLSATTTFAGTGASAGTVKYRISTNGSLIAIAGQAFPGGIAGRIFSGGMYGPDPQGAGYYSIYQQSTASAQVTGTTAETTLATITIPANSMGPSGRVRVTTVWSCTNNANNKTCRTRFGGIGGNAYQGSTIASVDSLRYQTEIYNKGATNSQEGFNSPAAQGGVGTSTATLITSAVDTTADVSVLITGQLAVGTDTLILRNYVAEILYGP